MSCFKTLKTFVTIQKQRWVKMLVPKMNQGVAQNCTSCHCIPHHYTLITHLYNILPNFKCVKHFYCILNSAGSVEKTHL